MIQAWELWYRRIYAASEKSIELKVVDVGLAMCAADEIRNVSSKKQTKI